jgi:excisionase family DNA binding protein
MSDISARKAVPDPVERPTLTVGETAVILRISRSTLYDALRTGEVPCIRVGRRVLVPTARLRDLLGLDIDARIAAPAQPTRSQPNGLTE